MKRRQPPQRTRKRTAPRRKGSSNGQFDWIETGIILYTDGSRVGPSPVGPGGWAAHLLYVEKGEMVGDEMYSGYELNVTNNQMEMDAIIAGLDVLEHPSRVQVISDSQYVVRGLIEYSEKWTFTRDGRLLSASGSELKNPDRWMKLFKLDQYHSCRYDWTRGHANDPFNNLADKRAQEMAREAQRLARLQDKEGGI